MLVEGKKTRVCFLQSERHTPGTCSSMEEEGEGEGGGHVPSVKLPDLCLRLQPLVMEICSLEGTSAGPSCSLLLGQGKRQTLVRLHSC